jgi:hypothetical protein
MSIMDLSTIRDRVRFLGDYSNKHKFPDVRLNVELQKSFRNMWTIVDDKHEGWWDTEGTVTTVARQQYVALPSDFWRLRGIDLLDGSEYVPLRRVNISDRNSFGSTPDQPTAYRRSSRGVELYATPDAAYTLRVIYSPKAPDLAENLDREWFNGWEEFVIQDTLVELDRREGRPTLNDRLTALQLARAVLEADSGHNDQSEPEYLPLREGVDLLTPSERGIFGGDY